MGVQLRRARPEDLAAVGRVTVAAYAPFTTGRTDPYMGELADASRRDRAADLWVAVGADDTTVLGTVTVCPEGSTWREVAEPGEGEFRMLAVDPAAQGRGVGRALTELALAEARDQGAHAVVLSSLLEMGTAHRLYERLGFVRLPERDWAPRPGVDLIAYRKELT